jgi:hypothetical protein
VILIVCNKRAREFIPAMIIFRRQGMHSEAGAPTGFRNRA